MLARAACALVTASGGLGAGLSAPQPAAAAPAQVFQVPPDGVFALAGHGWGHGHGLSQYGAYGAAKVDGLSAAQILSFYYPDTTQTGLALSSTVRVVLHGTLAGQLPVVPRGGAKLTATTSVDGVPPCVLPDSVDGGKTSVAQWRARVITTSGGVQMLRLQASTDGNSWNTNPTIDGCDPAWSKPLNGSITFDGGGVTDLVRNAAIAPYRGNLRAAFTGTRIYVVNVVAIDQYLRSVVPSEMPSSWSPAALQAQAVAARTYAAYEMAHPKNQPYYDVYDDTRDQMYIGQSHEAASTTAAVQATEDPATQTGDILTSDGGPAFTQFSSSNGGWSVYGGQPYLPAQQDPYDGLVPSSVHSWSTTVPASTIAQLYGKQIGTLHSIAITGRDGHGQWGGRVTSLELQGSSGTVSLTGTDFRLALGLRSEWFTVVPPPGPPSDVTATVTGGVATVGWQPPASNGGAAVSGYKVVLQPGGATTTVDAKTDSATISGLDPNTDYVANVSALSSSGPGWPATVTSKVHRLQGGSGVALAVASSQATFADGKAKAVVLVRRSTAVPYSFAAAALASATHAATLMTAQGSLPAATSTELKRALLPGGTVYLLGPASVISDDVRTSVHNLGYRVVRRDGANPAAVARAVAQTIARLHDVTTAVEVDTRDVTSAWVAGVVAAHKHAVVLLTANGTQAPETIAWLRGHPGVTRIAIGSAAAAADPTARPITGTAASDVALAAAQRWFAAPGFAALVSPGSNPSGLVAAARLAITHGPLLYADPTSLPAGEASYLSGVRADVHRVDLIGDSMPYDDVESDVQSALLGNVSVSR